jgi:hypothetical protein
LGLDVTASTSMLDLDASTPNTMLGLDATASISMLDLDILLLNWKHIIIYN